MMSEPLSLMYGIDLQTRCLVGVPAEQERTCFLVGTLSLKQENQLCVLDVDDDWLQISKSSFPHPSGEIWHVASSPVNPKIAATCHSSFNSVNGKLESGASLWKFDHVNNVLSLLTTSSRDDCSKKYSAFEFHPEGNKAAIAANKSLYFVDLEQSMKMVNATNMESKSNVRAVTWNPHSGGSTVAIVYDSTAKGIDSRSLEETFLIENAHVPNLRNLDFNPNVQYTLATCGDDCKVTLWDTRKTTERLKTLEDHSHWVWSVKFNPIHDQLILSASSDARLFLNSITSFSSETIHPFDIPAEDAENITQKKLGDERLEKVEEHEESVYACAWAGNDPWVFASLSYDGRLIVSRVKRHHKYAILRLWYVPSSFLVFSPKAKKVPNKLLKVA